jgi:subtilase family serine protease
MKTFSRSAVNPLVVILLTLLFAAPSFAQQSSAQQLAPSAALRPLITQPVDESQLTVLQGNTHPLARPQLDLGTAPATLPMQRMLLVLKRSPEQESALKKLLDDQQDKSSPSYHKWLTPDEFGKQFGPTDADLQTITNWLQSHGFQVGSTKGRTILEFSGSASQVQEAFHTTIHKYIVNEEQRWANASDPSIPTALTPAVAGIDSLHNFRKKAMNSYVGEYSEQKKQLTPANPNFTYGCGGQACYAIVPYDFATIYDVLPLWNSGINGGGQTIAIVGRTDIYAQDATDFWQLFGLTVPANKLNIIYNGAYSGINSDEGEADIDVQWSGAVAPQATIDFVDSASTEATDGVDLSALYIVDNNLAPVMSESYGQCELGLGTAGNQFHYVLWEQAAAQGISVFVSSGDSGAAGCDDPGGPAQFGLNVNGLASTPFNAAVGGTDFNQYNTWTTYWNSTNNPSTQESAKGYIPETTWNDSCTNVLAITLGFGSTAEQACNNPNMIAAGGVNSTAGSGGPSNCVVNHQTVGSCSQGYAKPSWQSGAGVPNDSLRDLPDISLFASNGFLGSFYLICQRDQTGGVCDLNNFAGYGGTSVASPAFAGIMSLVDQKIGTPQGVPGFVLYKLAAKQANAFHDVPSGSTIAVPCNRGSPNCTVSTAGDSYGVLSGYSTASGYDLATGLGSVDAANLVNNWNKVTFTATSATLQLNSGNPVSVTHGTAVPVNIGVSPIAAGGDASLLVSTGSGTTTGQAIDAFTLGGGSFAGTTSLLPGGSYSVIAHYAGDGNYGGSYSVPVSVTVSKENSSVILGGVIPSGSTSPVKTISFDSQYFVRADVGNSQGSFCSPPPFGEIACPSGGVIFTVDGTQTNFNTFNLNSEGYTETGVGAMGTPTGGTHTLGAQYSGDNNYNARSGTVQITVTKAATTTTQVTVQGAITQLVTLTTNIEDPTAYFGQSTTPTGTVTFYSNGIAIPGTPLLTGGSNGLTLYTTATLTTTFPAPGTYTLTASYSGDQNYQLSASIASQAMLQYPQPTVSATPPSQTVLSGDPVTITTLVDTGIKKQPPTGTVTLGNSDIGTLPGPATCTQTTDSSGNYACQATFTFTPQPASVSEVDFFSAQYSGDANYPASQSGLYWIYVTDFSLSPGTGTVSVAEGQSQQVMINVSALNGFTGTVNNFSCSGLPAETSCSFNPASVAGNGSMTLTISTTPLGQSRRRVAASYPIRWGASGETLLLGICLIGLAPSKRHRSKLLALMILALFITLPSCGGGGSGGGGGVTNNPVPAISSLSPTQLAAGSAGQSLTINGSGFIGTSSVTFNGSPRTVSFINASQLSIPLTTADVASTGNFPVVVSNPAPGGGPSGSVNFDVVTGTPTGNFTVTVTASSGALTHTTSFTLQVQ